MGVGSGAMKIFRTRTRMRCAETDAIGINLQDLRLVDDRGTGTDRQGARRAWPISVLA